jgi:hypothetical protein
MRRCRTFFPLNTVPGADSVCAADSLRSVDVPVCVCYIWHAKERENKEATFRIKHYCFSAPIDMVKDSTPIGVIKQMS